MPRDPNRIEGVINAVKSLWYTYPDLRLGQLLMNATPRCQDLYFVEDEHLMEYIKDYHPPIVRERPHE